MKYIKNDIEKYKEYKKDFEKEIYEIKEIKKILNYNIEEYKAYEEDTTEEETLLKSIEQEEKNYSHVVLTLNNMMKFIIIDFLKLQEGNK